MQNTINPQDGNENQVNGVKQPDQSANQKLDDSEDNNKKDDKQTQTSKITYQQAISNEVDTLARLSETHAAQGCGGIIGKVINDPGGFTIGCQQLACSGRLYLNGLPIVIKPIVLQKI